MRSRDRSAAGESEWIVTGTRKTQANGARHQPAQYSTAKLVELTMNGGPLVFFLVLFFFGRAQTRRRAQRFAIVEDRQIAHVQR